jgi:cysteine desulfurase family protein (TIGR01976 family)
MSKFSPEFVEQCRQQFPALGRIENGRPAVFFDGPAGTQVPQRVIDAFTDYFVRCNSNHGGVFGTAVDSDCLLHSAHQAFADFVGADDPEEIIFGQNMTSLTFSFSRALSKTWSAGDEIVVTRLDHDANIAPWLMAAEERQVEVRYVEFNRDDFTLDLEDLSKKLNSKTRLVAVGCASNATGGVNPVQQICEMAHDSGAQVFLDAVHLGPHQLIDVKKWNCDFLACSAYKFFGPHLGILWGKSELLESLRAFKVRPAPDSGSGKWMTGTQSHESIAGGLACVDYLADLGRQLTDDLDLARRPALEIAFRAIGEYERSLVTHLIEGLLELPGIKVYGLTNPETFSGRFATVSITHTGTPSSQLAKLLADEAIYVWHGHYYAQQFVESLGLGDEGMVRIGLLHYNTKEEVERLLEVIRHRVFATAEA